MATENTAALQTVNPVAEALTEIGEALRLTATADFTAQVLLDYSFEALNVNQEGHYLLHGNTPRRGPLGALFRGGDRCLRPLLWDDLAAARQAKSEQFVFAVLWQR